MDFHWDLLPQGNVLLLYSWGKKKKEIKGWELKEFKSLKILVRPKKVNSEPSLKEKTSIAGFYIETNTKTSVKSKTRASQDWFFNWGLDQVKVRQSQDWHRKPFEPYSRPGFCFNYLALCLHHANH